MLALTTFTTLALFAKVALGGTKLWDGSFNAFSSSADFDKWSWSNQVGPYQWYIHGSAATSKYLAVDPSYKNPASSEARGLKLTIDSTSSWNGQSMARTELIPQTTANLGSGNLFYHFSIKRSSTNPPVSNIEHQIAFFESHFTELKYGVGSNPTDLQWHVGGVAKWSTPWTADTWFNFAYDIDFSAGTVGLWQSTGSSPLVKVVQNIGASTSTNSADWHLGVLRIPFGSTTTDLFFSGVYVEQGPITTSVGTGGGGGTTPISTPSSSTPVSTPISTTISTTSSTPPTSTSTAAGPLQTKYGQCGGNGYTGPTVCASGSTCTPISPPYYSQVCQFAGIG
ncbi:hypothetical protein HGRIS_006356 [Hohenbuehelia grisea]|uniref:CBM1 domain-containing protein n=1 Tax=Hohenbuehelia grisea TaxID=104357 RepID=A0ABR3JZX2_9AGAR